MADSINMIITRKSREKLAQARAGIKALPKIHGMAFGRGGVDGSGTVLVPNGMQEALNDEMYRKTIDSVSFPTETTARYACTLLETELVGESISEIGLYDEDGDIVCIRNFTAKGKDDDIEVTYIIDDIF